MSRKQRSLFDSVGDAASNAGSEALAAISNLGGGDAGGTVGRLVSAVFGKHGGFAPKVITSVTKHGIAGIERVEPIEGVDRGYRAVAADANGLESIRTIIELDPREYDVTVTREEGAGVVEFVQVPEPEPEQAVEPKPPVKQSGATPIDGNERAQSAAGRERSVETATAGQGAQPVGQSAQRDSVAQARAEAEKAKAEAEAEKARAEAETARAEAEAAKARARAERARANAEADAVGADPASTPELDGGTALSGEQSAPTTATPAGHTTQPSEQRAPSSDSIDAGDADPAFSPPTGAGDGGESAQGVAVEPSTAVESASESGKRGDAGNAGGASVSSVTAVESATDDADGVSGSGARPRPDPPETGSDDGDGERVSVDGEFGSFVAASPVDEPVTETKAATDAGIGRWAGESDSASAGASETDDSLPEETGSFEF